MDNDIGRNPVEGTFSVIYFSGGQTNHLIISEGQSLLPYKKKQKIQSEVTSEDHAVEEELEIVTKVDDTIFKASSSTSTSKKKLPMVSLVIHHSTYAV